MANITKLTSSKKEEFIKHLTETGNVTSAAYRIGMSRQRLYEIRREDSEFATAWANAFNEFLDIVEAEVRRRAIEGVEEPVFYQGQKVGTVRKYSDVLLMFYLKAKRSEFREGPLEPIEKEPISVNIDFGLAQAERERIVELENRLAQYEAIDPRNSASCLPQSAKLLPDSNKQAID